MTRNFWLSYDLGIQGDYNRMYAWLDNHSAVECGDSAAFLQYDIPYEMNDETFMSFLKKDLEESVSFKPGDRVYIVRYIVEKKHPYGKFLIGNRKSAPWEGYGDKSADNNDDGR